MSRTSLTVPLSRRRVLRLVGLGASLAAVPLLQACGANPTPTPQPKPAKPAVPASAPTQVAAPKPAAAPTLAPAKPTAAAAVKPTTAPAAAAPTAAAKPSQPLQMAFVPSSDSERILKTGKPIGDMLGKLTGYTFEVSVPTSYAAVIEAVGASKVDIAFLAPFAYVLAQQKYGADVILTSVRQGSKTYRSQIISHADSSVKELGDLKGKKFAFADPASASGFLYPAATLKEKGHDPNSFFSEVIYAGGHDKVVIAVYNKQVDGGATFGRSTDDPSAPLTDARVRVKSTLPDVLDKVKILVETDPIPNDTVSVRKGLDAAIVDKVKTGLLQMAKDPEGAKLFKELYTWDGVVEARDADYDGLRKKAQLLGFSFEQALAPAPTPTRSAGGTVPAGPTPGSGTPAAKPGATPTTTR